MSVADVRDGSPRHDDTDHGTRSTTRRRSGRAVPALDGIRALAVLAVLLYHFGVSDVRGGFLGVDVFFVLSGYLITGQLMTRWVAGGPGSVGLARFWSARARRLLPGLAVFLLGTTLVVLVLDRSQLGEFRGDLFAAGTYSSNWWYVFHHTSYFVAAGRPPVLEHLWSLAVEEQFYLIWPLVVAAVVLACPTYETRRTWLLRIAAGVALVSTLVMAVGSIRSGAPLTADPSRWYFGSDSHVMGLLTGAWLAVLRHGDGLGAERRLATRAKPVTLPWTVAGLAALGVVLLACARADEFSPWLYRGGFAAVGVATAVVVAVATRPGLLARLLSIPLLRAIGQRSYALYLWHWPVACFTRPGVDLPIGQTAALLLRLGLSFLLAEISYQWVERPVREHGWRPYWGWLSSLRIGSVTAPAALTLAVAGMTVGLVLPASAAPSERGYRAGGTVYVSDPGRPGQVRIEHGTTPPDPTTEPTTPTHGGGATSGPPASHHRPAPPAPPVPHDAADLRRNDLVVYGDSVALGAIPDLAARFRSVTNHAVEGIQSWTLLPALTQAGDEGLLDHDVVLVHTGDNGVISRSQLETALASLSKAMRVILAVPYVPRDWQTDNAATVESVAGRYPNVRIMRWDTVARAHPEDLWTDGVHLTPTGQTAYAALVTAAAIER